MPFFLPFRTSSPPIPSLSMYHSLFLLTCYTAIPVHLLVYYNQLILLSVPVIMLSAYSIPFDISTNNHHLISLTKTQALKQNMKKNYLSNCLYANLTPKLSKKYQIHFLIHLLGVRKKLISAKKRKQ